MRAKARQEIYAEIGQRNEALVLFVSASTSVGS